MTKFFITTAVVISFTSLAYADNGIYTSLKAGVSDTTYKNSTDEIVSRLFNNDKQSKSIYPTISVAVGYDFSSLSPVNLRTELEYSYKGSTTFNPNISTITDLDIGGVATENFKSLFLNELSSHSLMLNSYYDFKNQSKLTPYIGMGVGVTRIKNEQRLFFMGVKSNSEANSDNHFTWSATAGIAYEVTKKVALDLSYRYVDSGKFEFKNTLDNKLIKTKVDLNANEYLLGVRYNF